MKPVVVHKRPELFESLVEAVEPLRRERQRKVEERQRKVKERQ